MKTGISLPDPLFEQVERYAHQHGLSRSELVRRALETFLAQERDRSTAEQVQLFLDEHGARTEAEMSAMQEYVKKAWAATMGDDEW